ncbi:MAG: type II toxin-antitoxin system HicA family toxin [Beijerinckiaceae bacterium]|nr:type II toxin-antitoxin system HicA family toxin [Beijerinckiaceae bacterium]
MSDRLEKMRASPAAGWRMSDIEAVCRELGVFCAPPRGISSHHKVGHPSMAAKLTIPFNWPIKPIYIRKLVAFLDAVRARK